MINNLNSTLPIPIVRVNVKAVKEKMQNPLALTRKGSDVGGAKHLRSEVTTEEAPRGTVGRRTYGMSVGDVDEGGAVREEGGVLD